MTFISVDLAGRWLAHAGYDVDPHRDRISYRKPGIFGTIAVQPQGVDERSVLRVVDRGS